MKQVREKSHTRHRFNSLYVLMLFTSICVHVFVAPGMEKQLAELETLCKQKEEERVELELKLTEVKENLKKSLARGALGPPTDTKIHVKVGRRCCSK